MLRPQLAALILSLNFSVPLYAEMISTGVGIVRGQVVTSREVQINNLLQAALYDKDPKYKLLALDSKAFNRATQDTLLESVVALEAQNFNVIQLTPEEVREAEKKAEKKLKGLKIWKDLQVSSREMDHGLRRMIQAKKFIQLREQSSILPVTDVEAERYFNENRLKYDNMSFENFKEDIKSYLSRTQVERRMKDWFDVLLSKYQVKNLIAEM